MDIGCFDMEIELNRERCGVCMCVCVLFIRRDNVIFRMYIVQYSAEKIEHFRFERNIGSESFVSENNNKNEMN